MSTHQEEKERLWRAGVIAPWYLRPSQLDVYLLLRTKKNAFVECARRFGKTTSILCYVLEELLQNPGWICRWCEPFKNQCRDIVMPEIDKIQAHVSKSLRFKYSTTDSVYEAPNGSRMYLRGVNEDKGDSARGPTSHIIVADEFGTWRDPDYVVNEALSPQLDTTNGPFIIASTPPKDLGHRYYTHKVKAISEDRFIQKTIYDNETMTEEKIAEIAARFIDGLEDPGFKREYRCLEVPDPRRQVVPEYTPKSDLPNDHPVPPYFDCYVGGDSGADDNTAILFAYYDFLTDTIVVEDEYVASGKTSEYDVQQAKEIEKRLWGEKEPYSRVFDSQKKNMIDIIVTHKYVVTAPQKDDKHAAIKALRMQINQGKFKVKERCRILRHQLRVGMWSNEKKTDFQRSEDDDLKHLDALAAAVYLNRSVNKQRNPYPLHLGQSVYTHFIDPHKYSPSQEEEAFLNAFQPS